MLLRYCPERESALFFIHIGGITVVETALTSAIVVGSFCLLGYWFRYACLLMVARYAPTSGTLAKSWHSLRGIRLMLRRVLVVNIVQICEVAAANELSFPEVQALLLNSSNISLDDLYESLDHDYVLIDRLLTRGHHRLRAAKFELFMLAGDYRLLSAWYRIKHFLSLQSARDTLEEMTWVIWHLADHLPL